MKLPFSLPFSSLRRIATALERIAAINAAEFIEARKAQADEQAKLDGVMTSIGELHKHFTLHMRECDTWRKQIEQQLANPFAGLDEDSSQRRRH